MYCLWSLTTWCFSECFSECFTWDSRCFTWDSRVICGKTRQNTRSCEKRTGGEGIITRKSHKKWVITRTTIMPKLANVRYQRVFYVYKYEKTLAQIGCMAECKSTVGRILNLRRLILHSIGWGDDKSIDIHNVKIAYHRRIGRFSSVSRSRAFWGSAFLLAQSYINYVFKLIVD